MKQKAINKLVGIYGAAGAGATLGPGGGAILLTNQNGAVLALSPYA